MPVPPLHEVVEAARSPGQDGDQLRVQQADASEREPLVGGLEMLV